VEKKKKKPSPRLGIKGGTQSKRGKPLSEALGQTGKAIIKISEKTSEKKGGDCIFKEKGGGTSASGGKRDGGGTEGQGGGKAACEKV